MSAPAPIHRHRLAKAVLTALLVVPPVLVWVAPENALVGVGIVGFYIACTLILDSWPLLGVLLGLLYASATQDPTIDRGNFGAVLSGPVFGCLVGLVLGLIVESVRKPRSMPNRDAPASPLTCQDEGSAEET